MTEFDALVDRLKLALSEGPLVADEIKEQLGIGIDDPALRRAMKAAGVKWDVDLCAYRLKERWER